MNDTIQENKLATFIDNLSVSSLPYNEELKSKALTILSKGNFPTTREEAWKYTRVGRIATLNTKINHQRSPNLPDSFIIDDEAITLVFENGFFSPEKSSSIFPEGLVIKPLSSCTTEELSLVGSQLKMEGETFNALNTAFATDGIFILIEDKATIDQSIQCIHIISGEQTISSTRNFIQCGKFSKAHIIQSYFSLDANASFSNNVSEIVVGENAHITIDKIQYESLGNFHIATEQVSQAKDSEFTINTITLNGTLVRNNLNIEVNGTNCTTILNGVYLLKENQHVDNHTIVDHKAPHCESHELYKGVMDDKSTGVFNGKVFVRPDSQKINAFQSNANVLLSGDATINSKPELEIYADDVKCSHGSTTGQLDEEAIFYLRARGISEKSARHLMVFAFIEDVLSKIENKKVLNFTHKILKDRFGWEF